MELQKKLQGIPIILKDNVDVKGLVTTAGSLSLKENIASEDSFIVKKFKEEGAIILAKVNLHEFAIWGETISSIKGQTINPYDSSRTPGGSSGGTGASIALNFGTVGIGTDTINSVRSPSSANSLVGIRPTIGLVSRGGIVPYSYTQDTAGPLARTVEDAVKVLDVISGYDKDDIVTSWSYNEKNKNYLNHLIVHGLKEKRIGVLNNFFGKEEIHYETNVAVRESIEIMKLNGADIIQINDIIDSEYLVKNVSVHLHDLKDHLNSYLEKLPKNLPHSVSDILKSKKYHSGIEENLQNAMKLSTDSDEYNKRLVLREKVKTDTMNLFSKYDLDAIVYPHQKQLVCKIGESQNERNGVLASVTGFPSICMPSGFSKPTKTSPLGVPIGLELLGTPFSEEKLIEISYSFEIFSKKRQKPKL